MTSRSGVAPSCAWSVSRQLLSSPGRSCVGMITDRRIGAGSLAVSSKVTREFGPRGPYTGDVNVGASSDATAGAPRPTRAAPARILAVGNMYPPQHAGGYELAWQAVVRRAHDSGHAVRVLTTTYRADDCPEEDPDVHRTLR